MKDQFHISTFLQQLLSADQAYQYRIVPTSLKGNCITFKTDADLSNGLQRELEIILGKEVILEATKSSSIEQYLSQNYRQSNSRQQTQLSDSQNLLDQIIQEAKALGSSDIHFEIFENRRRVRFRIDGKLIERYVIPKTEYPKIINQLKVKSGLDIAEKRLPQDGRINFKSAQESYDIRVSSLPTLYGEKLVLRLLSKDATNIQLEKLGFNESEFKTYTQCIKNQSGIILISGPTGSGKTTTLYATLKLLNNDDTNILTIEDPIEYTLEGINQVQLKENIGLDFSKSLRTFLRQDPDIIMVGEIRDVKTANMAVRASLTGHLVLSTIHTNSAWATISRLIDMGVPSFLIASTLKVSVAQRLVRLLCPHCKVKQEASKDDFPMRFTAPRKLTHHLVAKGCSKCYFTGYMGRKAIYEIIPITKALADAIKNNLLTIDDYLKENGIATLKDNAMKLVEQGETSIDEIYPLLTNF